MTRIAVAAWVGAGNTGDELILSSLLRELRSFQFEPLVLSANPVATKRDHEVDAVSHRRTWHAVSSVEGLIFGGGGLVQDRSSPWSPLYQLSRPWLASRRSCPVLAVGLGAEPLGRHISTRLVRSGLGRASAIVARDRSSASVLTHAGLPRVRCGADLVWLLETPPVTAEDRVAVSLVPPAVVGSLLPASMRSRTPSAAFDPQLVSHLAVTLDGISEVTGLKIRFVSMDPKRDDPLHRAVAERMHGPADVVSPDVHGVLEEFASARLVIAARYHACLATLIAGRPLIALDYAPKVRSLNEHRFRAMASVSFHQTSRVPSLTRVASKLLEITPDPEDVLRVRQVAEINREELERFASLAGG